MKYLVTGAAGFIGHNVCKVLLARGDEVVGLDNLNDYYDVQLKKDRLQQIRAMNSNGFLSIEMDLADRAGIEKLFKDKLFLFYHL